MIQSLENFFSKEFLYICLTAVLLNIFLSVSFPIIYNFYPVNPTAGLNRVTVNLRQNLFSSSIYVIIIVSATLLLSSHLKAFLTEYNQASVLNLTNLIILSHAKIIQ